MPIFHDHGVSPPHQQPASQQHPSVHARGRVGYMAHERDGALLDSVRSSQNIDSPIVANTQTISDPPSPSRGRKTPMLNRVELIERIKRGNSPSWPHLQRTISPEPRPASRDRPRTPIQPAAELNSSRTSTPDPLRDHASLGITIERPRSALHSGDFREKKERVELNDGPSASGAALATSPVAPWHHSFPASAFPSRDTSNPDIRSVSRSRGVSQSSFASGFVFMPPTSPLVQQSNNTDLDFSSRPTSRTSSRSPERGSRRHTFSPHSFQVFRSSQMVHSTSGSPAAHPMRREGTFPYQAHQPRRSLNSFNHFQPQSTPQTPLIQPRRPSFTSESPLHHAPMVGSYEESILRGRMSTTPSRPLNFVAQIGVLGKGQCKSSLRCPPHVTVPFPAVFYSYNSGNGRIADNSPSPYVGLVDLENSLGASEDNTESRRKRRHTLPNPDYNELEYRQTHRDESNPSKEDIRRREKKKRRSTSPKAPPGGSYRIPQQGQLQIVIKNPNKTAVKLFLVPYDLSDMEPGQKTFVRQRSYSAGPIIDMPMSSRKNLGTDRPEASLSNSDDPNDRPILRYLIHLHVCCPSKGRYYLYKSIRVVFANRVPDGKEKLRNEIQLPEPRYSTYKASRDSLAQQTSSSSAAAQLTADKAFHRRSAGYPLVHHAYDRGDGRPPPPPPAVQFTGGEPGFADDHFSSTVSRIDPIPFSLSGNLALSPRTLSRDEEFMDVDDPESPFRIHTGVARHMVDARGTTASTTVDEEEVSADIFEKLNKGDVGYGGNAFCGVGGTSTSPGAGLLTRSLRGLDVHPNEQ
ncbi:hypothetical protein B0J11DRAFT_432037 [Dendryphion nanum]|uniref:Atos-like conserved domain-containing protein n=1 Tax=Dendryphion nanum TaxID=256645 RepID=A0A9P9E083_9PLEO|nr:hypothetical protein B0J11DRAFT_432037 [Dendryphion nanum]